MLVSGRNPVDLPSTRDIRSLIIELQKSGVVFFLSLSSFVLRKVLIRSSFAQRSTKPFSHRWRMCFLFTNFQFAAD
jgi:hypothetical protein